MQQRRFSGVCVVKAAYRLFLILSFVKCYHGFKYARHVPMSGWGPEIEIEECDRQYTWEPYTQECLTSLWLEAGCLQSGTRSPQNSGDQQLHFWNERSVNRVQQDMQEYYRHAMNGDEGYKNMCFGNTDDCKFQVLKGHALYGYNDKVLAAATTQTCAAQCNNMRESCKSFDYNNETQWCFLSSFNRETGAEAFGTHESLDYYEKVCGGVTTNPLADINISHSGKVTGSIIFEGGYCYMQYGPLGGSGGVPFNDKDFAMHQNITKIAIRYADAIDAIQVTYGNRMAERHGGGGGSLFEISLDEDEVITGVKLHIERVGERIVFITNKRAFGPFGNNGYSKQYSIITDGKSLAYIAGRNGVLIDQLTFVFNC